MKAQHSIHKSHPTVSILSQTKPVHNTSSSLSKIYPTILHPPKSWSSNWNAFIIKHIQTCMILDFHGGDYEKYRLLGRYAVWLL
jgi:hypothetical protein